MTGLTIEQEALQVLRHFNAAASTVRLYPKNAPQVEKSIEKAFREMELYVSKNGAFSFSCAADEPILCQAPFFPEKPEKVEEFPVFIHLHRTGLHNVLFTKSVDRTIFNRILQVFTTDFQKIEQAGGGHEFIKTQGVSSYFPDILEETARVKAEMEKDYSRQKTAVVDVPLNYLLFLYGKQKDPRVLVNLKKLFQDPGKAMAIIASAVARLLRGMQQNRSISSPLFPQVVTRVDQLLLPDFKHTVAVNTASFLVKGLKAPALCVLLSQQFPTVFGRDFYLALVHLLKNEIFEQIIILFEKKVRGTKSRPPLKDSQYKLFVESYERLKGTQRGKQFFAAQKVDTLIRNTEQQQQKKRAQNGAESLLQGNVQQLKSKEFLRTFPLLIESFIVQGQQSNLQVIIEQLNRAFAAEAYVPAYLMQGLLIIADKCVEHKIWVFNKQLIPPLLEWVKLSEELDELYEKSVFCLQIMAMEGWRNGENDGPDQVADVFHSIRAGELSKSLEIEEKVSGIQDENFDAELFSQQLGEYLQDADNIRTQNRLMHQGISARRVLLRVLMDADQTETRLALLELLTDADNSTSQIVLERLNDPMPWYNKRNLIKLIGETGNEQDVKNIYPFLNHENQRVQQEALSCIYKISGPNKKKHLLAALPHTSLTIRSQVVKALIPFADEEVAEVLIGRLEERHSFSDEMDNEFLVNICSALGHSLSVKAVNPMKALMEELRQKIVYYQKDKIFCAAKEAIHTIETHQQQIKQKQVQSQQLRKKAVQQAARIKSTALMKSQKPLVKEVDDDKLLQQFIDRGEKEKAKRLLMKLIIEAARSKKFTRAEEFRQQLIDLDQMALQEIIKAAEIIEKEKSNAIEKEQLQIWTDLRHNLTKEEFNDLYFLMDKIYCREGEQLVEQGEKHPFLYFITSGKIKLFCRQNEDEFLIKVLEKGSIFGTESFFNVSVWTMSATCMTDTELQVLSLTDLRELRDEFPGLELKLGDFCRKSASVNELFANQKAERREYDRVSLLGKAEIFMLDENGNETGRLGRGEFSDISLGGASIYYRISSKEKAQKLLGQNVTILLPLNNNSKETFKAPGVVVAVRSQDIMESEYTVHIRFSDLLEKDVLQKCSKAR